MAMDRTRSSSPGSRKNRKSKSVQRRIAARRNLLVERLEDRKLLAVLGPKLGGIQPNDGDLLPLKNIDDDGQDQIAVRNVAPRSLTFRFDETQVIDAATLGGIRILRSGFDGQFGVGDVEVVPGYIGVEDSPRQNEVIVRFAETLPDDLYRIELYGIDDALSGITALRNTDGLALGDVTADGVDNGQSVTADFELELGPQVVAVVPQPVVRVPVTPGSNQTVLQQAQNQIQVFFNNDDLFIEDDALGNPTARSAENPAFYQLIFTRETVDNTDDVAIRPISVNYDPDADMATLTFAQNLDQLLDPSDGSLLGPGTFRLRVGTNEVAPPPPTVVEPAPAVSAHFNTGGQAGGGVDVTFTAREDYAKAVYVSITKGFLPTSAPPSVSVVGDVIRVVLNENGPSTADDLRLAIEAHPAADALIGVAVEGDPSTDITVSASAATNLRVFGLGSSFETASVLGEISDAQYLLIQSSIDAQQTLFDLPGSSDEPGQRDLPLEIVNEQYINPNFGPDSVAGITTIYYNFRPDYGFDANGNPVTNSITENQKTRVREAVELWGQQTGVQFLETVSEGMTFVSGDLNALNPNDPAVVTQSGAGFRVRTDPEFKRSMLIIDSNRQWNDQFGADWFQRTMIGMGFMLGLQLSSDMPVTNLMSFSTSEPYQGGVTNFLGGTPPEPVFPGNRDLINAQYIHQPEGKDIDLYRFDVRLPSHDPDQPKTGLLTVESFAERLPNSSLLDTVLSLYREVEVRDANGTVIGYERELIARNDDYFSSDSYVSVELGSGTYYIGVTASGNTNFDPVIEDTGWGGTSQGDYQLRFSFRAQTDEDDSISDRDRADEDRPGSRLDGDADGTPGGVYNFWFQTRPLDREIRITGDGSMFADGQTLFLQDGAGTLRRFEFDSNNSVPPTDPTRIGIDFDSGTSAATMAQRLYDEISSLHSGGFGVTAALSADGQSLILSGDRSATLSPSAVGIELAGKTIFVDKTSGAGLTGSLEKPFDTISSAFAAAIPGDIVRIVGNGGVDGNPATIGDNFAYEIGLAESGSPQPILKDGSTMEVPQGVTAMIDAGAIFKLRRARIGVGSSTLTVDRSGGALQVLGAPYLLDAAGRVLVDSSGTPVPGSVYFTSRMDENIGQDGTLSTTAPAAGDWGGIVMRADLDNAEARPNLEAQGIFLNYVNHADIRYGGGLLKINALDQIVNPIQILETRPTITNNRITESADAAMSADPNSFEETNFHSPRYQPNRLFTSDYVRVGPEISGNYLQNNSINGLFLKINTPAGNELKALTVPGRFDDTDIVHVISENLKIQGEAGEAMLETSRPALEVVTLASQPGGSLAAGDYRYKLVFVDVNGFEGRPSEASDLGTVEAGEGTLLVQNLPPVSGNYAFRRLYRSQLGGEGPYQFVADLDASDTIFVDKGTVAGDVLQRDPPSASGVSLAADTTGGSLVSGRYTYRIVFADDAGKTSPASDATLSVDVLDPADSVRLANLPAVSDGFSKRLIYRSGPAGAGPYTLIGELDAGAGSDFLDSGVTGGEELDPKLLGVVRARLDARLKIDPGTVVKLEGARIEATFGAQLIAEGLLGQEVIFTSKLDDRYGAGGTFDTNDDGLAGVDAGAVAPTRGQWAGLYIGQLGRLNLDHAYVGFGGGDDSKIEGTFKGFNVIEIHQAEARITNSVIEQNDDGTGGQGPYDRFGRGPNDGATIFVRGARPVLLNNTIRDNSDVALNINVDSFTHHLLSDPGRTTGPIDQVSLYRDNQGPLVRGNRIANNGPVGNSGNVGTNGMEIRTAGLVVATGQPLDGSLTTRGITLSTESVWDDTDIVHILYDEIRVPDFRTYGGLRLESSADESLVVKLFSPAFSPVLSGNSDGLGNAVNDEYNVNPTIGAGFTATGRRLEIEDRIGGTIHLVGQPGFPVILTSLHDDTVGAGLQPDGTPQTDTNNNGIATTPEPADWRSVRLDQFSHDRNVELSLEQEAPTETAPGINGTVTTAQFLGDLAASEAAGDENHRMGFEIHGFLNSRGDVDVYSFTAEAGTEVWLDLDRTTYRLDTVIEVLNSDGVLIALSDNSTWETSDPELLFSDPLEIADTSVNPLQRLAAQNQPRHVSGLMKDHWTTNERDAGMRVLLPGALGTRSAYTIRVRSSNLSALDPAENLQDPGRVGDGLTSGVYRLQLRTREVDEVPGSTVRYADIRYAQNGVEVIGLPKHSPLLGEASEDENVAEDDFGGFGGTVASNDSATVDPGTPGRRPQDLGNLFASDRAVLSVAGTLADSSDLDFYRFRIDYEALTGSSGQQHGFVTFDMDYADGLGRANSNLTVYRVQGDIITPVLVGRDSNVADDRLAPVRDVSDPGVKDLSRGSVGELDPYIGTVALPEGDYLVAVSSARQLASILDPSLYPEVRLEPINSLVRIAEDRIGSYGGSSAEDPLVPVLLDPTFVGTSVSPTNLWHVSTLEGTTAGHGLTPSFDGSRLGTVGSSGVVFKNEPNNSLGTAQNLEGLVWSLDPNANVLDAEMLPHVTVRAEGSAAGNGTNDYYSFVVTEAGSRGVFDIDFGCQTTGCTGATDVDTNLLLFDAAGNVLSWGTASLTSEGAGGSNSIFDPLIDYVFDAPGTYFVGVGAWPYGPLSRDNPIPPGRTYQLQLSVENHLAAKTTGSPGQTFYFGNPTGGYDLGAGNVPGGSLVSNAFSLQDYSAADKPVLYYNYQLSADAGDHFRVYIQRPGGSDVLVASSAPLDITGSVVRLFNSAGEPQWRQARIPLDQFASLDGLRIRYDFTAADDVSGLAGGLHIDDVIIGFAERGEMITQAPNVTSFQTVAGVPGVLDGAYQLEIRKSASYGTSFDVVAGGTQNGLTLERSFDTNDRLVQQTTLVAPSAADLQDGQTFRLGDGANVVVFEFDNNNRVGSGNVRIAFHTAPYSAANPEPDYVIAARIRDALNGPAVQSLLRLQAVLSDGTASGTASQSNKVVLFGNASGDILVQPRLLPVVDALVADTATPGDGDALRLAILGSGVEPVGQADLIGGARSAGFFSGGSTILGLDSGIVLSTGDIRALEGPNADDRSSAIASGSGDADLDAALGLTSTDTASLEFQFSLVAAGTLYLDYVFASEEYNERLNPADGFAILVKPQGSSNWTNYALVPGTSEAVSTATVNRTANRGKFNNNDPSDAGEVQRDFGYDGFTDPFRIAIPMVAGIHQVKFVLSDVGDQLGDSAVFIAGSSFSTTAADRPQGIVGLQYDGFGDQNAFRDQGQTLIHSNTILHSADFAIVADAGQRDTQATSPNVFFSNGNTIRLGSPHMGPVRNLHVLNDYQTTGIQGGFAPGTVISNNTLAGGGLGGIHFSGDLAPYELTVRRGAAYDALLAGNTPPGNATAGDAINDGDWFSLTVGRTTVEFEFEDMNNAPDDNARKARLGGSSNPGWEAGRVPVYYEKTIPNNAGYSEQEMAQAIKNAIDNSILVTNGTTLVARTYIGPSRSYGDPTGLVGSSMTTNDGDWAVYVENAREVSVYGVHDTSQVFQNVRVAALGQAAQPFGRIVNNTIHGNDGSESFFTGNPTAEPNDTIFNAVDTRQGASASPEIYTGSGSIGDNSALTQIPSSDVDAYKFQLDVGDRVVINVTSSEFAPQLRLFNAIAAEFPNNGQGAPNGAPRVTTAGDTVTMEFYAQTGGTYFVTVSGPDNVAFSPLSTGNRTAASSSGDYDISVDVSAPRSWVIDTRTLVNNPTQMTVYGVNGVSRTITTSNNSTTEDLAIALRGQLNNILPGITATSYGGINNEEPRGYATWIRIARHERFVVVHGASKITGLNADTLWSVLDTNNDNGLLPETGVLISEQATPTLLNNVLSNNRNAIIETLNQPNQDLLNQRYGGGVLDWRVNRGSSSPDNFSYPSSYTLSPISSVVGGQLYQDNTYRDLTAVGVQMRVGNWGISDVASERTVANTPVRLLTERVVGLPENQDFNITLAGGLPLFVNAADQNFFPAPTARSIDSSVSTLEDRPRFQLVKQPMGLADSPILAPTRDSTGQLRIDDPNVAPPQGQGQTVFIDRGSLDRSDFVGPLAELIFPRDNDTQGVDIDPANTVVHLTGGVYGSFSIQLIDGFETADPFPGVGVNDSTVLGPAAAEGRLPGASVTVFQNGVYLEEQRDYTFRYDPISNTIHLIPISGIWRDDAVYLIELNNRDRFVINAPQGDQAQDGEIFQITDTQGVTVTFEYDTGYNVRIPQSLAIQVPAGAVTDGQRFQIRDAANPLNPAVTFEIDLNGVTLPGNQRVSVASGSTPDEIGQAIVDAIDRLDGVLDGVYGLGLSPKVVGGGVVHLGASEFIQLNTELSSLIVPPTVLTLAVPELSGPNGIVPNVADGQRFSVNDGTQTAVFEFDSNGTWAVGNQRVNITLATTAAEVGAAIELALRNSPLALDGVQHVGGGLVHVNTGGGASIDLLTSRLFEGYAGLPVADGERFTIRYDHDSDKLTPSLDKTFEFSRDGVGSPGSDVVIAYSLADTHEDLGLKMASAINAASELNLTSAKHLQDGLVFLGGTTSHDVDLLETPSLSLVGRPDVQTTTRLNLPRSLTVVVPAGGGAAINEGDTFTITDLTMPAGQQSVTFEFDDGISGPVPGNTPVFYVGTDAEQLADNIITAINNLVLPGFLAGVTPTKVADATGEVGVELSGSNGNHSLSIPPLSSLSQKGGRIADGERFTISLGGNSTTFEYDNDGRFNPANTVILFTDTTSPDDIAASTVASIRTTSSLNLPDVEYLGNGVIDLHDTSQHVTTLPADSLPVNDSLFVTGIAGGSVRLPFEPWSGFGGDQLAAMIVQAINDNMAPSGVTASLRGGNTLFVDFLNPATNLPADFVVGPAAVNGISNYFLRAIQDIPGNPLKANQFTDRATFTVLLPGAQIDFGDATDSLATPRYPTLFDHNGARHVIADPGYHLGSRVDADPNGQPVPGALGDDLDHRVSLGTSPLQLTGLAPYVIQVPPAGVVDRAIFTITAEGVPPTVFEFVDTSIPDNEADPGRIPVFFDSGIAADQRVESIANSIVSAVSNQRQLGLNPLHMGGGVVFVGGSGQQRVDTRSSHLTTSGMPTDLILAVTGAELVDGERFTIEDGRHAPVVFEFDADGSSPLGVRAVAFDPADPAIGADVEEVEAARLRVALAIKSAIEAAQADGQIAPQPDFTVTSLGDGRLHLSGVASHRLDLASSGLLYSGHTPAELVTPGAGLGLRLATPLTIRLNDSVGGGVAEGQTFVIDDGQNLPVTFEFDGDGTVGLGHVAVAYSRFNQGQMIAEGIESAIQLAISQGRLEDLAPEIDSSGDPILIHLNTGAYHSLDTSASGLQQSGPVDAGQTFTVRDGAGAARTFEFVRNAGDAAPGRVAVVFDDSDSANEIANALVAAVDAQVTAGNLGPDVVPRNYGGGEIQIGGNGSLTGITAPSLTAKGQAGGVLDGQTFELYDGISTRRFEFDADQKSTPGNLVVLLNLDDTAEAMAEKIISRVSGAGYRLDLISLGGGRMRFEGDDDDGIFIDGVPTPGSTVPLLVTASAPGYLDAWIDFNNDGDFLDQFEHVYAAVPLDAGVNEVPLQIPATASIGQRFARFRFSQEGGLEPTGLALNGEVEDYLIEIFSNDPPLLVVPGPLEIYEDQATPLTGITVADPDSAGLDITVSLSVLNGTLTVNPTVANGLTPADIQYVSPGNVVLTASVARISATLAHPSGLIYQGSSDFNGADLLTIVADDRGNEGTGGPRQERATVPLTVLAVNDAPQLTVPGAVTVVEDQVLVFPAGGISVFDVEYSRQEVPSETPIELTLSVANGVLAVREDVPGGVLPGEIVGNGSGEITLLAPPSRINATLQDALGLSYDSDEDFDGDDALSLTLNDLGNLGAEGAKLDSRSVAIHITAVNDPPRITVPNDVRANEDTPRSMIGFDVADVDSRSSRIEVQLRVSGRSDGSGPQGTLDFDQAAIAAHLDIAGGDTLSGDGSSVVTITAAVDRISALLSDPAAWSYVPPDDFAGNSSSADPADWAYEILTVVAEDFGATGDEVPPVNLSDTRSLTLFVDEVNDPPQIQAPSQASVVEDQPLDFTGAELVRVSDPDLGAGTIRVTVTALSGTVRAGTSGPAAAIVLDGTLSQVNAALAGLRYQGNANFNGTDRLVITANDKGNSPPPASESSLTITISVTADNDAPQINMPGPLSVPEDTALVISQLSISDPDVREQGSSGVITVTLAVAPNGPGAATGTLTVNPAVPGGVNSGNIVYNADRSQATVTADIGRINATLASPSGLTFQPLADASGEVLFTVVANDGGQTPAPARETSAQQTITILAENDFPVISGTGTLVQAIEDTDVTISGVSISDVDAGSNDMRLTLAAAHGTLALIPQPGLTGYSGDGATVVLTGSQAAINSTLAAGIVYRGDADFSGADTIAVTANDLGNSPSPERIANATINVSVAAVNDSPRLTTPGPQSVLEDTALSVPGISVSDPDINDGVGQLVGKLRMTLAAQHGTLTLRLNVSGGVLPTEVLNNGTGSLTITSTPARINATLAASSGLTYLPSANYNSRTTGQEVPDVLTIVADDLGNSGGASPLATAEVPITVLAVNDAPQLTLPSNQAVDEDQSLVISFAPDAISDVDASEVPGNGLLYVVMTVDHGTVSVRSDVSGGLVPGDFESGSQGSRVAFTALASAINTTLFAASGVLYQGLADFNGSDTLHVTVSDLGNSDANAGTPNATPQSVAKSLTIAVAAVNDPPTLTAPATLTVDEDNDLVLSAASFQVADVDAAEGTGDVQLQLEAFNGTIGVNTNVPGGVGVADVQQNGSSGVVVVATPDQINATLANGGIFYRGLPDYSGTDQLLLTVSDVIDGVTNTGKGGSVPARATVNVTVNPVNDAPTVVIQSPAGMVEDTPLSLTISVGDAELSSAAAWTLTLDSAVGTFTVQDPGNGVVLGGNGSNTVTLQGTGTQIKAALEAAGAVTFQGNPDFAGSGELSVTILDRGSEAGSADDRTVTQTASFSVGAVNDAPRITLPVSLVVNEDNPLALSGGPVQVVDVDSGAANIVVTLRVNNGKLNVSGTVAGGLTGGNITTNGTNRVVLTGTSEAIGRTLADGLGLQYVPTADYFGSDVLVVTADDRGNSGTGGSLVTSDSVTITVSPVNDAPEVANPVGQVSVVEDAPNTLIELFPGVFRDADNTSLTLTVTANSNSALVAATINGTLLSLDYQPDQNGTAILSVTASDGQLAITDTFTVTVAAAPDSPFVDNPIADVTVLLGTTIQVINLANVFADPDAINGDTITLSYTDATDNSNRNLLNASLSGPTLTLTFIAGRAGRADLTVHASDSTGREVSDTFAVTVNAPPVARDDEASVREDTPTDILITGNDTDADGLIDQGSIELVATSGPLHGSLSISDGLVTYTPDANFSGADSFRYTVRDDDGFVSNEATVSLTVTAVADYRNPLLPADVNRSGEVSPIDALITINYINANPGGPLPADPVPPEEPEFYYDVDGNGIVSAADVLQIINYLNGIGRSEGEAVGAAASFEDPGALLVAADYSLAQRLAEPSAAATQRAEDVSQVRAEASDTRDWNTGPREPASRDAEFESLAHRSSLFEQVLDDVLGEIASDIESQHGSEVAADWVLSGLKPR